MKVARSIGDGPVVAQDALGALFSSLGVLIRQGFWVLRFLISPSSQTVFPGLSPMISGLMALKSIVPTMTRSSILV